MCRIWMFPVLVLFTSVISRHIQTKPIVDPGLFMILGVQTCRNGTGYCLLGVDCTLDEEFVADDSSGHCEGLKTAFTPVAHFTCCKYKMKNTSSIYTTKRRTTTEAIKTKTTTTVATYTSSGKTDPTTLETIISTIANNKNEISTTIVPVPTLMEELPEANTELITPLSDWKNQETTQLNIIDTETDILPFLDVNDEVIKEIEPPQLNVTVVKTDQVVAVISNPVH